jgi:metallophosphoesterase superfamily enzyme
MKVAIITDQHFGFKKGLKLYHDYFLKFYEETFFPTLDREGITTILDLGDTFDNRKGIDSYSLDWAKKHYFDPIRSRSIDVVSIVGNHTAYYKNTNELNTNHINGARANRIEIMFLRPIQRI